jgi:predicted nucleic acid-binding protein
VLDDEPDNRILECAVAGQADIIITGDRTMLNLKRHERIRIVSLRQFLEDIADPET